MFFQVFQDEFWDNPASRQSDCQQDEVKYQQMSRRKLLDDADVEFPESMATSDYIKSVRQTPFSSWTSQSNTFRVLLVKMGWLS